MKDIELCGQRVRLETYGPDTPAPPLFLIHGAGHDHAVWQAVASGLAAQGEQVITPDLPAHGGSGGEPLADIDAMARWVLDLADALGFSDIRLGGHSMGSLVTLAAAAAAPQRVKALTLIGCLTPMPVAPFVLEAARNEPEKAHALINKFSFAPAEVLGEARRAALEACNLQRMQAQAPGVLATDMNACDTWQGGLAAAAVVSCPSLLICGQHDRMTPPNAVKPLYDALENGPANARMIVLAGSGHAMLDEEPEAVIKAMRGSD